MSRFTQSVSAILFNILGPLSIVGLLLTNTGCNQPAAMDAKTLSMHRSRLALADEPDDVQTVAGVRVAILGEQHDPHVGHDHDGDGHPDHAAEDHDAAGHDAADHDKDEHADQDHDEDGHEDHAAEAHAAHADHEGDEGHDHAERAEHGQAHASEVVEVSMVGHIGGLANPWDTVADFPFDKSEAVFFLADPQAIVENEASGHSHAPGEECAYCAAHAADNTAMLAMVRFVDKNGNVLPIDARQLFDVKEKDTVVVSGQARVTAGGILVVDAQGLYIRK